MLDLEKLTPAPWFSDGRIVGYDAGDCEMRIPPLTEADAEFIVLARQAFDVMMRRGWNPIKLPYGGWIVEETNGRQHSPGTDAWPDPFTALVEADRWHSKQEADDGTGPPRAPDHRRPVDAAQADGPANPQTSA